MSSSKSKSKKKIKSKKIVVISKTTRTIRNRSKPARTVTLGAEVVKIQTSTAYGKFGLDIAKRDLPSDLVGEPVKVPGGGPRITKGDSLGIYATQMEFIRACEKKFGKIVWDLAASTENTRVPGKFFSIEEDALKQDWTATAKRENGILWLNPPFTYIAPWAEKALQAGVEILFLVPASVGSKWFKKYVFEQSDVNFLDGRLQFEGQTSVYPKDCMLVHFTPDKKKHGISIWEWRKELEEKAT